MVEVAGAESPEERASERTNEPGTAAASEQCGFTSVSDEASDGVFA